MPQAPKPQEHSAPTTNLPHAPTPIPPAPEKYTTDPYREPI
jgi:hypothetical protein